MLPGRVGRVLRLIVPLHRVVKTGVWTVIHVAYKHRADLPGVLVGDAYDHLAEWHPPVELAYPEQFEFGLPDCHRIGALQAATSAPDQQHA